MAEKITKTITITCYDCGDAKHSHRTNQGAERCIAKRAAKSAAREEITLHERLEIAVNLLNGSKVSDEAKRVGRSSTNIISWLNRVERLVRMWLRKQGIEAPKAYNRLEMIENKQFWLDAIEKYKESI